MNDETGLSHPYSPDADLPRPDAVWLLHIGAVCSNGGIWRYDIPILHEAKGVNRVLHIQANIVYLVLHTLGE